MHPTLRELSASVVSAWVSSLPTAQESADYASQATKDRRLGRKALLVGL